MSIHADRLVSGLHKLGWTVRRLAAGRLKPDPDASYTFLGNSIIRHTLAVAFAREKILHVHDRLSILTFVSCLVARARGMKIVLTEHGVPRHLLRRTDGVDVFLSQSVRMADQVIAVNTHVEEILRPYSRKPIDVCPAYLPATDEELDRMDSSIGSWLNRSGAAPIVTLLIYRLAPPLFQGQDIYGLRVAREAVLQLIRDGYCFRFAVLLACAPEGDQERLLWESETERLRVGMGENFCSFVGAFAPPLIGQTEVFLRPTLSDGDAVSVREALDLGCQVIASDAVPRPEGVEIHRRGDSDQLAQLLGLALKHAPQRIRQRAVLSAGLQKHIAIYESLLSQCSS